MKALRFSSFADNLENLTIEQLPDPPIQPGEAKIKVVAACINPSDVKNLQGNMSATTLPRTPGRDFAGLVVDGPANLLNTEVWGSGGDIGFIRDGSHAEFLVIPTGAVSPKNLAISLSNKLLVLASILSPLMQASSAAPNSKRVKRSLLPVRRVESARRFSNSGKRRMPNLSLSIASHSGRRDLLD